MKRPSTLNQLIFSQNYFKTLSFLLVFFLLLVTTIVHSQIPDTLLSASDTNYFQITSKIDAYINSLPTPGSGSMGSGGGGTTTSTVEEDGWEANYNRWKSYWESRIDGNGNFKKYNEELSSAMHSQNECENFTDYKWQYIGPKVDGTHQNMGRITSVCVNPNDENDIIIAGNNSSFFRTKDGGATWKNTADDEHLSYLGTYDNNIIRYSKNSSWIFAGTSKLNSAPITNVDYNFDNIESNYGSGIVTSYDNGETWGILPGFNDLLEANINDLKEIYALCANDIITLQITDPAKSPKFLYCDKERLYSYTYNQLNGQYIKKELLNSWSFTSIFRPIPGHTMSYLLGLGFEQIIVSPIPEQQNKIYTLVNAGSWESTGSAYSRKKIISFDYDGENATNPIDIDFNISSNIPGKTDDNIQSIGFDYNYRGDLIVFINFNDNSYAFYKKLYNSNVFTFQNFIPPAFTYFSNVSNTFRISPYNENVMYVECFLDINPIFTGLTLRRCIMKSTNGGISFSPFQNFYSTELTPSIMHVDLHAVNLYNYNKVIGGDPTGANDKIIIGTDGGVCKTTNGGITYSNINGTGLDIGMYYGVGVTNQDANYILAGAQDGSYDTYNENLWTTRFGGDKGEFIINPINKNKFLFTSNSNIQSPGNIYNTTITDFTNGSLQFPIALDNIYPNRIYAGYNVVKSNIEDTGIPIPEAIINNNTDGDRTSSIVSITNNSSMLPAILFSQNYFDKGDLVNRKGGIFKAVATNSSAVSWNVTEISGNLRANTGEYPLKNAQINDIVTSDSDPNLIWVVFGNLSEGIKVFRTNDGGVNWINISGCLPNLPVFTITYQKGTNNRIYIGNQLGVYYHDDDMDNPSKWVRYGDNQLDVAVYDLDINYCGNYLVAATFGRGVRKIDLLPSKEFIVQSDFEWNNQILNFNTDLHIMKNPIGLTPTTIKLTNGTILSMAANKKIIIDQGCKLLVDNSTITNECNTMWEGIVVKGDKQVPQELTSTNNATNLSPTQGFVYLNNATISYAKEAIRLWNPDDEWVSANQLENQGESGGIVIAENATFINNRRSVEFMWYKNYDWTTGIEKPNVSSFKQCTFKVTDDYRTDYPFYAHVSMWDNRGINYKACTFANNKTNLSVYENKGMGIISMDANYTVENIGALKSQFKNLTYGVNVINSQKGATSVNIIKSAFNKNQIGAYLLNASQSIVSGNSIWLGRITNDASEPDINIIGIGFNQSGQFTNKDNIFSGYNIAGASAYTVGEWFINNSLTSNPENESSGNKFSKIPWASYANYYNRKLAIDGTVKGLQFKCNKNENNMHDFYSWSGTSTLADAGIRDNQGNMTSYAGNTFSTGSAAVFSQFNHNESKHINYYVSEIGAWDCPDITKTDGNTTRIRTGVTTPVCPIKIFTPPTTPIEPQGTVLVNGMGWIETDDKTKLTPTERTNAEIAFINHKNAYQSYASQLNALIDAGNTDVLLTQINVSTSSTGISSLRTELLGASPYLSQTVLEATVNNTALPAAVLFEILGANPDAGTNQKIIDKLIELNMPQYMIDYIQNNIGTINAKKLLESAISEEYEKMMKFHRMIIQDILNDPIAINHNEYRGWLGQLNTIEADYEIVDDYIALGQYTNASEFMNDIQNNYTLNQTELDDYTDLLSFNNWKIEALTSTGSLQHLDNNRIESLQAFANNGGRLSKERAQSIINYFYDGTFQTTPEFPTENNQRKANPYLSSTKSNEPSYTRVYPNPAKDLVFFEYLVPCNDNEAILEIRDLTGKLILQTAIDKSLRQYTLNIDKYVSGNYIYKIICGGTVFGKGQFSVVK